MRRLISGFELEVFDRKNARSRRLTRYIAIYTMGFAAGHRTKTNELMQFLAAPPDNRNIICFGLSHDGSPVGFAMLIVYPDLAVAVMDHLVIKESSRGFGAFFHFADLIKTYLDGEGIAVDHLVAEIVVDERHVVSTIRPQMLMRLLRLIGFKVAKIKYWAPDPLILDGREACKAACMIASQPERGYMSASEFLKVVNLVYQVHYYGWYRKTMNPVKFSAYKKECDDALDEITDSVIKDGGVILNGVRDVDFSMMLEPTVKPDFSTVAYILFVAIPAIAGAAVAFKQELWIAGVATATTTACIAVFLLVPRLRRLLIRFFRLAE
jgi:hypothetical protein